MASHEIFAKQSDGSVSKKIFTAPVGSVVAYPVDSVPDHCLECNGAVVSRALYPELFAVLGTVYGAGDGTSTFKLPDFRDQFLRGAGGSNGAAIGTAQAANVGMHGHFIRQILYESVGLYNNPDIVVSPGVSNNTIAINDVKTQSNPTGETRPANYAVKYCIIFE